MAKDIQVKSLAQLKKLIDENDGSPIEGYVVLKGSVRSCKTINYADMVDKNGAYKLEILNEIDETKQILTEKNLFNEKYTNIGKAINQGSFYVYAD